MGSASRDILLQTERIEEAAAFYERQLGLTRFMDEPDMIGLYAYGFWHVSHGTGPAPGPVVRVVQADVRQEAKYDARRFQDIVDRYLRLTAQPSASGRTPGSPQISQLNLSAVRGSNRPRGVVTG